MHGSRYLYLNIPKQNKLASLRQHFVLYGIVFRKMVAEQYKVNLIRDIGINYGTPSFTYLKYINLPPKCRLKLFSILDKCGAVRRIKSFGKCRNTNFAQPKNGKGFQRRALGSFVREKKNTPITIPSLTLHVASGFLTTVENLSFYFPSLSNSRSDELYGQVLILVSMSSLRSVLVLFRGEKEHTYHYFQLLNNNFLLRYILFGIFLNNPHLYISLK